MVKSTYPIPLQRNQISWKRCGSIAEALRARRGRIAEAVQLVRVPRQTLQLLGRNIASEGTIIASPYTYIVGKIAVEVAVFDSQDPVVHDRSTLAALHGGS